MTFVLMLAATAAVSIVAGLVAYWLTVFALRTLDRLAPYWYVRYIVAGRETFDAADATWTSATFTNPTRMIVWDDTTGETLYDWRSDEPDGS